MARRVRRRNRSAIGALAVVAVVGVSAGCSVSIGGSSIDTDKLEESIADAEGRLILADALTYATRQGATRIVDMATLTGAVIIALGDVYAGLLGNDADWTARVRDAAEASGDLAWELPLHERYAPLIESNVADLANSSSKRQAGTVYAAQFLREFVDGRPWCHLDIAGTATPGGRASGYGVRLVHQLAKGLAGR